MASHWDGARLNWSMRNRHDPHGGMTCNATGGIRPRALFECDKILIAEDVASIAWLLYDILTEAGYEIVGPAATSSVVAELVAERRVDAALLDIGLADGPSFSLAESLAAQGIPFAFLTAYGSDDIPLHLRDRPIIGKPTNVDALLNVMKQLCRPDGGSRAPTERSKCHS